MAMAALAGGAIPWVDAFWSAGLFYDQVNQACAVGAQWKEDTGWGGFNPATAIVPGLGLINGPPNTTEAAVADPVLQAAVAAALLDGDDAGPTITIRLEASGANAQDNGWYLGRFDLPGYNCAIYPTVNDTTEASDGVNYRNGVYNGSNSDPGFVANGVPPHGSTYMATLYPDLSAKVSCGGSALVNVTDRPAPYTTPTDVGLALVVPASVGPVSDYCLKRATIWLGDISQHYRTLSA
jgi:hypothetical protein